MDMRNAAAAVVMEVIATAMVPLVPEEETISPTLFHDNTAVVADCPNDLGAGSAVDVSSRLRVTAADDSVLVFLVSPCEGPTSPAMGARPGTAIAA